MGDAKFLQQIFEQRQLATTPQGMAEKFYDSLGLMRGNWAPMGRMAVGFAIGAGVMFAVRPSVSFGPDGEPLSLEQTSLPWWLPGLAIGVYSGVFV